MQLQMGSAVVSTAAVGGPPTHGQQPPRCTIQWVKHAHAPALLLRPLAVTLRLTWGARPPRAQWAAPSRPTACTQSVHCLVRSCTPVFGARARRTAAEAAAVPIHSNCIVTA